MLRFLALLALLFAWPVGAADSTYRDPRQPSFTLLVPDGWTVAPNDQGVTISRERAYFNLRVFGGSTSPGALLVQVRPQFEQQWKNFRESESGRTTFGKLDGAFVVYRGIPPSSVESFTRIVAASNGRLTFAAFIGVPVENAGPLRGQLDRIERSFAPDPVR